MQPTIPAYYLEVVCAFEVFCPDMAVLQILFTLIRDTWKSIKIWHMCKR